MAKVFFAGDVHGNLSSASYLIRMAAAHGLSEIYQVGDWGYWEAEFTGEIFLDEVSKELVAKGIILYWIDGNHENFELLYEKYNVTGPGEYTIRPNIIYLARGTTKVIGGKKFIFCGGAVSIDKRRRIPYISWWPHEQITWHDSEITVANGQGADVMVLHDAPAGLPKLDAYLGEFNPGVYPEAHAHRVLVENMVRAIKPKVIVHGHYHFYYVDEFDYGTGRAKVHGLSCDGTGGGQWKIIDTDDIG